MRPKKLILIVDDKEQVLSVRRFLLETRGYRVLTALNAKEAMSCFLQDPDLVITDLVMPDVDGNELARQMKEANPTIPVMITSGQVHNCDGATKADCFLPKGACSTLELMERIRQMVARKRGPRKRLITVAA